MEVLTDGNCLLYFDYRVLTNIFFAFQPCVLLPEQVTLLSLTQTFNVVTQ